MIQASELDRRSQLDAIEQLVSCRNAGDTPDRNPAGEDAVDSGAHDLVTHLHVAAQRDEVERQQAFFGSPSDPLPTRAPQHRPDRRRAVGQQLHLGIRARHRDDAPHGTLWRHDRLVGLNDRRTDMEHQRT